MGTSLAFFCLDDIVIRHDGNIYSVWDGPIRWTEFNQNMNKLSEYSHAAPFKMY